jgi:putative NADH-flavin reductase
MEKDIRIAVIGGTGKSGKYLVKQLLKEGLHLRLLVRNPERLMVSDPLIEVIIGDVKDYAQVTNLIRGCQAVISTLGMGVPPDEPTVFSQSTKNIIRAMDEHWVQRYIVITGLNVDTPFDNKGPNAKFATEWMYRNYPLSTTDKQEEYRLLRESDINWTLVRLPMIELTERSGNIDVNNEDCKGDKISATDLASFLSGQLFDESYVRMAPFISNY